MRKNKNQSIYAYVGEKEISLEDFNNKISSFNVTTDKLYTEKELESVVNLLKKDDILILYKSNLLFHPSKLKYFLKINKLFGFDKLRIIDVKSNLDSKFTVNKIQIQTLFNVFELFSYKNPPILIENDRLKYLKIVLTKEEYEKLKSNSIQDSISKIEYSLVTEEGLSDTLKSLK